MPTPNTVTITATVAGNSGYPAGSVNLAILNPIPTVSGILPSGITEGVTTITVAGTEFVYGAQILWNGSPVATTFISCTEVAAAVTAPQPGNYTLAVGNPNPGAANSSNLAVPVGPGKVVLQVQPGNTDVRVNDSLNLGLTVTGTMNTGVTLAVNGVAGGNSTSAPPYPTPMAPSPTPRRPSFPRPATSSQLTITSIDNPTVSINQNVSVLNPIPILTSATPMNFNAGPPPSSSQGQHFINGAQVLHERLAGSHHLQQRNQLTATLSPTEPGNLDLQVLNPSPGPATSADLIALVNGTPPRAPRHPGRCLALSRAGDLRRHRRRHSPSSP